MTMRMAALMMSILLILLYGTVGWGVLEHRQQARLAIQADNQYQRAFHEMTDHLVSLQNQLGQTIALSEGSPLHRRGMMKIWQIASEARAEINQLPLANGKLDATEQLLANLQQFAYRVAVRPQSSSSLQQQDVRLLHALHKQAQTVVTDVQALQNTIFTKQLHWLDAERWWAQENSKAKPHGIVAGITAMNDRVNGFKALTWGEEESSANLTAKKLSGKPVSDADIRQKAMAFAHVDQKAIRALQHQGQKSELPTVSITVQKDKQSTAQLEYTVKGGHLLSYSVERPIAKPQWTMQKAIQQAEKFGQQHGFGTLETIGVDRYDDTLHIQLAKVTQNVTIYPQQIMMTVALDDGEVVQIDATPYWLEQHPRKMNPPTWTAQKAKARLQPEMQVTSTTLALLRNEQKQEVLCYEFVGSIHGETYKVHINANSGEEEGIEKMYADQKNA
jgi:spore germination protein